MATRIIRQGDVGLVPLSGKPEEKLKATKTRLIRKGENGGTHQLETLEKATIHEVDGTVALFGRYIEVKERTDVVHQEHKPVTLKPGWYGITIQRESFNNITRFTAD